MKITTNTCQYIWLPKRAAKSEPTNYETIMSKYTATFYVQAGAQARALIPAFHYRKSYELKCIVNVVMSFPDPL